MALRLICKHGDRETENQKYDILFDAVFFTIRWLWMLVCFGDKCLLLFFFLFFVFGSSHMLCMSRACYYCTGLTDKLCTQDSNVRGSIPDIIVESNGKSRSLGSMENVNKTIFRTHYSHLRHIIWSFLKFYKNLIVMKVFVASRNCETL